MHRINNFNINQPAYTNQPQRKVVFQPAKISFSASNPFATDILDISTAKLTQNKPLPKLSVKQAFSFLGDKIKDEGINAKLTQQLNAVLLKSETKNVLKAVNKVNQESVPTLIKAKESRINERFSAFDMIQILESIDENNKDALPLLMKAYLSGQDKYLNSNVIRTTLKAINKDSIEVLKTMINPETGEIDRRIVMGLDIQSVLTQVTHENKDNIIALWRANNSDGTPKLSKFHVLHFSKNTKPEDIPLLFDLLQVKDHNDKQLFNEKEIGQIFRSNRTNKKQLIQGLKDLPNLNGARIATVVEKFNDSCIAYLKQNIHDTYRVDLLFALQPYSEEMSIFKIIESSNIDCLNNTEREHLAELLAKKEYKDVVRSVNHLNVPLMPRMEHRDDFMNYLLATLKQNINLERLPGERVNHFRYHLNQLEEHIKSIDPLKDIDFNRIYDSNNILINLPEHLTDLKNDLNTLIYVLPETRSIFESSTKAKALLTTLSALFNDNAYNSLSENEKEFAKIATILSFLPAESRSTRDVALEARISTSRLDYSQREQGRIYDLVKNQNWLDRIESKNSSLKGVVSDCFVRPGDFKILTSIAKAKIRTGNSEMTDAQYSKAFTSLKPLVKQIVNTSINLPQTQIPKASSLHLPYEEIGNDRRTNNKIVRMNEVDNFEAIGFPQGTNRSNIYFITHVINENIDRMMAEEMIAPSTAFDCRDTLNYVNYVDSVGGSNFSASLVSVDNNNVFINQRWGFVFDVDPADIAIASHDDLWSGFDKNENVFTNNIFSPRRDGYSASIKKELAKAVESERLETIYNDLYRKTSMPDMKQSIATAVKTGIDTSLMNIKEHNELLLRSPKVKAIFCKDNDPNLIPFTLRHHAETHDLPIIMFNKW